MIHPFTDEEFKAIYSRVPRLCVDLVVRSESGVVLTLRSLPSWSGKWHMPGGTVLYREKVADAALRVAKREIGVEVAIVKMLGIMEFPNEVKERGYGYSVSIVVLSALTSGTLLPETDEASEIRAYTALPENMIPEHKAFLTEHWDEVLPKSG